MKRFWGILIILLAIGIALIPQFSNCQYEGRSLTLTNGNFIPMKCLWTARAELVTGFSLAVAGIISNFSRRKESLQNLSIIGMFLSIGVILLPTILIGVCQTQMMCNTFMRPAMLFLGSLTFLVNAIGFVVARKQKETEFERNRTGYQKY